MLSYNFDYFGMNKCEEQAQTITEVNIWVDGREWHLLFLVRIHAVPLAKMLTICMLGNFTGFFNKDWHNNVHSLEIKEKAKWGASCIVNLLLIMIKFKSLQMTKLPKSELPLTTMFAKIFPPINSLSTHCKIFMHTDIYWVKLQVVRNRCPFCA